VAENSLGRGLVSEPDGCAAGQWGPGPAAACQASDCAEQKTLVRDTKSPISRALYSCRQSKAKRAITDPLQNTMAGRPSVSEKTFGADDPAMCRRGLSRYAVSTCMAEPSPEPPVEALDCARFESRRAAQHSYCAGARTSPRKKPGGVFSPVFKKKRGAPPPPWEFGGGGGAGFSGLTGKETDRCFSDADWLRLQKHLRAGNAYSRFRAENEKGQPGSRSGGPFCRCDRI